MSFYFTILSPHSKPLFRLDLGTSKQGGDSSPRFTAAQLKDAPRIVNAALDILDEIQWGSNAMYFKTFDPHHTAHVSAFVTGVNAKFMLLSQPLTLAATSTTGAGRAEALAAGSGGPERLDRTTRAFINYDPTSPDAEESVKKFFIDVYELWVKTVMNPFYHPTMSIDNVVFTTRVQAAARKHL